ncbi:GNAT family N-acetyltransferase [Pedobacter ureilyticus]|uniref:GNAT family N-acetyltransferase n=1 Tax=Pedobacter ureilyticus TaxID=1393051 RepID=A0ABW9J8K7_9SPHI|nr:GNAT family N-acetyltransferase [Pedobacter helvus]
MEKPTLTWAYKSFNELSTIELYTILKLRSEVFIVEQHCNYQDVDGKDLKCHHLMAWDGDNLVAYTRIVPPGVSFTEASIGRVLSNSRYRGIGAGITLMEKSIEKVYETHGKRSIRIGAQLYLKKFYESFGFVKDSEEYLEDEIPHIEMVLA